MALLPARRTDAGSRPDGVAPELVVAAAWTWRLLVVAAGLVALVRLVTEVAELLVPVLVALLLTALLRPVADALAGRGAPRSLAALVTLLGALLLVVALFALVGQQAVSGFPDLREQAVAGVSDVQDALSGAPFHLSSTALSDYATQLEETLSSNRSALFAGAVGAAATATHLVEGFFIAMFSTFFFLSGGPRIWAWVLRILPHAAQAPVDDAGRSGWTTLSHYVRATLIVALVDGVGVGAGAAIVGVPLALPLGVLVFLGAFIPVVGALLSGIVAVLVALVAKGPVVALVVLGIVVAVNQLEAHVLQPFLLGRAVEVHPLAVIFAIAAGASVAGVLGALFAVPLVAVGNTVVTSLARGPGDPPDPGEQAAEQDAPLSPDKPPPTDVDDESDLGADDTVRLEKG